MDILKCVTAFSKHNNLSADYYQRTITAKIREF